jgi:hypothetical protein
MLTRVEDLLEQHQSYDLGDGWRIKKAPRGWWIAYKAWSVDLLDANHHKWRCPDEPTYYPTAVAALAAASEISHLAEWAK